MQKKQFVRQADVFSGIERLLTAQELVEAALDGADFERGQIEEMRATTEKNRDALARLVDLLYRRDMIAEADVYQIAGEIPPEQESENEPEVEPKPRRKLPKEFSCKLCNNPPFGCKVCNPDFK